MKDLFKHFIKSLVSPGVLQFNITPDDDNDLEFRPRRIITHGVGQITWMDERGTLITYPCVVGSYFDFRAVRIMETDTTSGLVIVTWC